MENLLKLITENPYRMIGVFANSSTKEIMANKNKALAYGKVGKEVSFPADLVCVMTPLNRTMESIAVASSRLAMPEDRLLHAQFWFLREDEADAKALELLVLGDMDGALRIWGANETASSLQNQMLCYFLQQDLPTAISTAETLYDQYGDTYSRRIDDKLSTIHKTGAEVSRLFLETLESEMDLASLYEYCQADVWKEMVKSIVYESVLGEVSREVELYRGANHEELATLKKAGEKLMEQSKEPLKRLQKVLTKKDPQYQALADLVGEEILGCCIEYINKSEANIYDSVHSTYKLLIYAKNTIVGMAAKRHFDENYEAVRPILGLSRDEYYRAVRQPFMRKLRRGIILGLMLIAGIITAIFEREFSGFWMGMAMVFPLCLLVNRIMLLLE